MSEFTNHDEEPLLPIEREAIEAAYRDPAFPERECDRCGEVYRGPAVYCSFKCAVDDA